MIVQEQQNINGTNFLYTYSDTNHYILQNETNTEYVSAYDVIPCIYTYSETNKVIENIASEEGGN